MHPPTDLAHYARACTDITFKFPFGEQELAGFAARGCYDLTQHQEASGKNLEYHDEARAPLVEESQRDLLFEHREAAAVGVPEHEGRGRVP